MRGLTGMESGQVSTLNVRTATTKDKNMNYHRLSKVQEKIKVYKECEGCGTEIKKCDGCREHFSDGNIICCLDDGQHICKKCIDKYSQQKDDIE